MANNLYKSDKKAKCTKAHGESVWICWVEPMLRARLVKEGSDNTVLGGTMYPQGHCTPKVSVLGTGYKYKVMYNQKFKILLTLIL